MWYNTEIIFQNVILYNILASKEKFTTNRICAKTIINANAYASQRSECWSESSCSCILCVCDQISCVGPYICIFIFYTQPMQKICLSVSVRLSKCTREILHHLRNYLKYMSTNKTNESVSPDEPAQIRRLIRAHNGGSDKSYCR